MSAFLVNKREIARYIGDFSQLFGVRDMTLNGGRAQGVRALEINNGAGLSFTVLPDRGLDIAWLSLGGKNLSYIARSGIVAPAYFQEGGLQFLKCFYAGFLTTCGLRNVGPPCEDGGEAFGLHGRIANVPAEDVSAGIDWDCEQPAIFVRGRLREARLFGEHLTLERTIDCPIGTNTFKITDRIENHGFSPEPLMLLYHFNFGYPLLSESAELLLPLRKTFARDLASESGLAECCQFQPPTHGYSEQVFHHDLQSDLDGRVHATLINQPAGLGVSLSYDKSQLPNLTEWKMMGEGDYVVGLEPCNNFGRGRAASREKGELQFLAPGEVRRFNIDVSVHEGAAELARIRQLISEI